MEKFESCLKKLKAVDCNVIAAEERLHKVLCDPEFAASPFFKEVLLARCDLLTAELFLGFLIDWSGLWKNS